MNTPRIISAEFLGTQISILDYNGQKWLTAKQAGLALGFDELNARKGVLKLYERHADEFTDRDTCIVNLTSQGTDGVEQQRATRIFSETGCNKLGFFAQTPRAKEFRAWAARALAVRLPPSPLPLPPCKFGRRVPVTRSVERHALERFVAGWSMNDIARDIGLSKTAVHRLLHGKHQFTQECRGPSECPPELIEAVAARFLAVEKVRLDELRQKIASDYRSTVHNAELAEAVDRVGRFLEMDFVSIVEEAAQ
jgi:hypothetical protein